MSIDKDIELMGINVLKGLVWACKNNTGYEPSVSCYHFALHQAEKFIEFNNALKDKAEVEEYQSEN